MPRRSKELTERQQEVFEYIKACIAEKYPPVLSEIAAHFGFSEKAAVDHVNAIEKKGYIRRVPHIPRCIQIIDSPSEETEAAEPEEITLEITPEMKVKVKGFSVGEYIRLRRQPSGVSGDIALFDVKGTLILEELKGHVRGTVGKVVGHTVAIE